MEFLDILNEDGSKTGIIKERAAVHTDGDLHGTSHIWISRLYEGRLQVLLQMRSADKDSHPSCLDTSSAGHISAGGDYLDSALRELEEELGLSVSEKELKFLFRLRTYSEGEYHGRLFRDNQLTNVYLLEKEVNILDIRVQKEEIQYVVWQDYDYVLKQLKAGSSRYCMNIEEFEKIRAFMQYDENN